MRIAIRFLAILTIAALFAPGVRWVAVRDGGESCSPVVCMCPNHHQGTSGQTMPCCAGKGGQCGLDSPDSVINSLLSNLIFVPTEHHLSRPLKLWAPHPVAASSNLLPSHDQPLDQPPRPTL